MVTDEDCVDRFRDFRGDQFAPDRYAPAMFAPDRYAPAISQVP
jgi:hypothetical protein